MIRVNLVGGPAKKAVGGGRKGFSIKLPTNLLPVVWIVILVVSALGGWFRHSELVEVSAGYSADIASLSAQRDQLQGVIDENEVFEGRREMLRNRVAAIEGLQRNQVSPVVVLDMLSRAISQIDYVWLSSLSQNNTDVSIAGTVTSQIAFADFIETLQDTGYFRNINFGNLQEAGAGFSFNLTGEFVPPRLVAQDAEARGSTDSEDNGTEEVAGEDPD